MILVLGGTIDSRVLIDRLREKNLDFVLSVTTAYGEKLARERGARVRRGPMDKEAMVDFVKSQKIKLIIDATHPFAVEVKENAMAAARDLDIPYIRYERPEYPYPSYVRKVYSPQEIADLEREEEGTIYLSTGAKSLADFVEIFGKERMVARVLPSQEILEEAKDLGLSMGQVHAIAPPFSYDLNKDLFEKVGARVLVTKESGSEGGLEAKLQAAHDMDMRIYLIARPQLAYPKVFNTIDDLMKNLEKEGI